MLELLFRLISKLPNSSAQKLGAVVGWLMYKTRNNEKRVANINVSLCFSDFSQKQRNELLKKTLISNAKTLCEMPGVFSRGGDYAISLVTSVSGIDHYHNAVAKGHGVIMLSPHIGNWELTVHYLNQFYPMTAMFAPPKQAFLNQVMREGRQSSGAKLVPADNSGVRLQLKHLKSGGVIGILPDQRPKAGHAGVFSSFMGNQAYTMLLVNSFIKRTQAIPLMTFAERLPNNKGYHLHIFPAHENLGDENGQVAADALNQSVEECVRIAPEQYQWTYKRFLLQPNNQRSPYSKSKTIAQVK